MAERIFLGGVTNTTMHIETDGTFHIEEKQDAEPILDYAHAARNHRFNADVCDGMLRHEAEIPFTVYQEECKKRGINPMGPADELVIEAILADPKYAKFRCAPRTIDPRVIIKGRR